MSHNQHILKLFRASNEAGLIEFFNTHPSEINLRVINERTSLMLASYDGFEALVNALLEKGACVNWVDLDRQSALHFAALGGHVGIARNLISYGADTDGYDAWGDLPADNARKGRHREIIEAINDEALLRQQGRELRLRLATEVFHQGLAEPLALASSKITLRPPAKVFTRSSNRGF